MSGLPAGSSGSAPASTQINPQYLSNIFSGGLPQESAATVDASQYGANPAVQSILTALQPMFAQQNQGLTEGLADAGIVGGSTTGAQGALAQQQLQQALAQLVPAAQTANEQQLGAQEFNAGALNNAGNQNVQNIINAGQYDTGTANTFLAQQLGFQNQGYLQNQQDQYGLDTSQASGQQSAFQPIYQQAATPNFSGLASGLGGSISAPAGSSGSALLQGKQVTA